MSIFQKVLNINKIYFLYAVLLGFLIFISINLAHKDSFQTFNKKLIKGDFKSLPGWENDFKFEVKNAFVNSCSIINTSNYQKNNNLLQFNVNNYKNFCNELKTTKNKLQLRELIEFYFDPYFYEGIEAKYTGYVELTLRGTKKENYNIKKPFTPILKKPESLITIDLNLFNKNFENKKLKGILKNNKVVPFPSRKEIENSNKFHEDVLVYVDDPAMAFFLHVQGSGRVIFPDGDVMYLGYADNNGKEYTSIGQELVKNKTMNLEDVSMHSLLKWLRENRDEADRLMHLNERYIFFEERKNKLVLGSSKSNLEAMHSVAVDNKYIPFHTPIWAEIHSFSKDNNLYRGLFLAHDTGAAIKGPLRFDLFLGSGNDNELIAGSLNSNGKAWFLFPKDIR